MNESKNKGQGRRIRIWSVVVLALFVVATSFAVSATEGEKTVEELEKELAEAKEKLANANDLGPKKIQLDVFGGTLNIGGAIRANYAVGDYAETGAASRAEQDGGNFGLDTFRINMDYTAGSFIGKLEYRWYNGYNFLHTGWLGYNFENDSQLQVGVNRVPFGPGPYGISQSWFFDQHYYLGLSDDMDLGIKYSIPVGDLRLDFGYYYKDEGTYVGASKHSARYSYDVVDETGMGYEERNQFNVRGIYSFGEDVATDLGVSLQAGELEAQGPQDDGDRFAGSIHMVNSIGNWKIATQYTIYEFDVDADQPLGTDKLVQFGAYDFPSTAAAEGTIPAISVSYTINTPNIPWLDYVIPYAEYSVVMKEEDDFNDSELVMLGAAWGRGGWYIYTDYAFSNGNEFVGGDPAFGDRLGANEDDQWVHRFNINFGYYF
jgi:hypothetical protein